MRDSSSLDAIAAESVGDRLSYRSCMLGVDRRVETNPKNRSMPTTIPPMIASLAPPSCFNVAIKLFTDAFPDPFFYRLNDTKRLRSSPGRKLCRRLAAGPDGPKLKQERGRLCSPLYLLPV